MVIGRSRDRGTPRVSRAFCKVADVLRTRSADPIWAGGHVRPHAGHMTASNRSHRAFEILVGRGPSTYDARVSAFGRPGHDAG